MNKIYKLVWSNVKHCYVVASELAKSHSKFPKSGVMSRALVAGVLASLLSFSSYVSSVSAMEIVSESVSTGTASNVVSEVTDASIINQIKSAVGLTNSTDTSLSFVQKSDSTGSFYFLTCLNLPNYDVAVVKLSLQEALDLGIVNNGELSMYAFQQQNNLTSVNLGSGAVSPNANSVALGFNAKANVADSVAIGANSIATESNTVSVGNNTTKRRITNVADGTAASNVATVGQTVELVAGNNVSFAEAVNSIGQKKITINSTATGGTTLHDIGINASDATSSNYTGAGALGADSIAIGKNASAVAADSLALMTGAESNYSTSLAIGYRAVANTGNAIVLGTMATSEDSAADGIAIGTRASASGDSSMALGYEAEATGDNSLALMPEASAVPYGAMAIGYQAKAEGGDSVVLGTGATSTQVSSSSVAIGNGAGTEGQSSVAIGGIAKAEVNNSVVIGLNAQSQVYNDGEYGTVVIGVNSVSRNGVAIGSDVKADGNTAVAIGPKADAYGNNSIALGDQSSTVEYQGIAIGYKAKSTSNSAVAIGGGSEASGSFASIALGPNAKAQGGGVAIGTAARTYEYGSVAVGPNARVVRGIDNSVAIGLDSWADEEGVVSFGTAAKNDDPEKTRRIVHIAAGIDDTDAVNVGQLREAVADAGGGGATYTAGNGIAISNDAISVKGGTNVTIDNNGINVLGNAYVASGNSGLVNGGILYNEVRPASNGNYVMSAHSVANNLLSLDNSLKSLDTIAVKYDNEDLRTASLAGTNGTKLTNLKQGTLSASSTDAVTGAQLYATNQNIAGFAADITRNKENIRDMNASVSAALDSVSSSSLLVDTINALKADTSLNNLSAAGRQVIATAATNAVQEYMASQSATNSTNATPPAAPKFMASGGMRLMSVNPAPADTNYVVYDDTSSTTITLEGEPGTGTKITNLADGELAAASTDAVTGSQLYTVTQQFDEFQSALSKNNTSIARAQTDINNIKTANLGLQSDVNTLKTQMESGFNVLADGGLVKTVNPDSNYIDFVTGPNLEVTNDNGSVKISAKTDGVVTSGNQGIVSGDTVYHAIQDALDGYQGGTGTALASKANVDASNIGKNADTDNSSAWGQALGTGTVVQNDDRLVTGNTVYNETRVASDSNYIKKDVSAAANLQNLDTAVKTNADAIAAHSDMLSAHDDAIQQLQNGAASTASDIEGLKDLSNLTDAGKEVIRSFAKDSVDVTSADSSVSVTKTSDANRTVFDLSIAKDGRVEEGNTGILTGDTVYQAIKDINPYGDNVITGVDSGAIGKRNTVAGNGSYVIGNDNTVSDGSDDMFVLGSNVNATGHNSVVLGKDSDGSQDNVVSVGSDGHERKIVHVADGSVANNSKDAVNGGQLYDVREDLRHANGVDVEDWSRKLGVGQVAEGNTGLVNGDTVYNALQQFTGSDAVSVDRDAGVLHIGGSSKYDDISVVDFSTSQGDSRVLTGVATNPNDPTSVANVGYVNAVNDMVIQSVNNSFEKVNTRLNRVGASAAAMSALTPASFEGDERWSLAASVGNYRSATAGAVGVFYKPVENVMMNVRGSFGNDENMVAAGVAVSLNKGDVPGVTKRQLANTVNAQAGQIQMQNEKLANYEQRILELEGYKDRVVELESLVRKLSVQLPADK